MFPTIFSSAKRFWENIFNVFRQSRLARILLLIVLLKFLIFYGFLKGFLYPRYLKPKWESQEQRSEEVMQNLIQNKNQHYD